jgi:hypothetical protein
MPTYRSRDFFVYSLLFATVAANGQANQALNIEQDSDFAWSKSAYFASLADSDGSSESTRVLPLATIQIQDTGSGRYLMNGPVALTDIYGTGALPFILPEDKIFVARSTIFVTVSNYSSTELDNLYLSFIGTKLFL